MKETKEWLENIRSFERFVEIVEALRAEDGCPWDREQTHESLRSCMQEEAAELLASIRIYDKTGNAENMREELGDILLQVVMHSVIAKEEGLFTMEDVIQEVGEKMIRRHPHVFGEVNARTSDQVLKKWEEIKTQEKQGKSWIESPLREIPQELPSLARASKVLKKADKLYARASAPEEALKSLKESVNVLGDAVETAKRVEKAGSANAETSTEKKEAEAVAAAKQRAQENLSEAMGDMLWYLCDLARRYRIPLEQVLTDRTENYIELCESEKENA